MATLFESGYKQISFKQRPYVKCSVQSYLTSSPMQILMGDTNMRTVFNIEIKTDIPAHDEERRKALIELFMRTSRTLFTQTTMVSKGVSPSINITSEDNVNGTEIHPLFEEKEDQSS